VVETPLVALVIDGNATSRRFAERALEAGGFAVEVATDGASALEALQASAVDVIVSESELGDQSGLALYARLAREQRLRALPFLFLSSDRRVETRLAALEAGVDDFLVKPCEPAELSARARARLAQRRRASEALRARSHELAGSLSALGFADLVGIIDMGRRSGVLTILTGSRIGCVYFHRGALVHATYGNLVGERAFQSLFAEPTGHFEFTPGDCPLPDEAWTIEESTTGLLMEAARILDTERGAKRQSSSCPVAGPTTRPAAGPTLRVLPPPPVDLRLAPAQEGDVLVAAQLAQSLSDPFTLAELRAWCPESLRRATSEEGSKRLVVVVLADTFDGVSAMLSLGGGPSEAWVRACLSLEPKSLGLTFALRHGRSVDVVLGDVEKPGALVASLGSRPAVVVVAPPDGDLLALGAAQRVALEEALTVLAPHAVLGVGNRALGTGLVSMGFFQEGGQCALRCTKGRLTEGLGGLREHLVEGFRVWASSGPRLTARPPRMVGGGGG
jgi:CheY-like chemotaxis protein